MELKSVTYRVADGSWQELTLDEKLRQFVSKDGKIKVAKPVGDGTVTTEWEGSEYTVICTPGYDPTICTIHDPSKSGRVDIRFGSSPPTAKPSSGGPPTVDPPAPTPSSGDAPLSKTALQGQVVEWILRDYPAGQRSKALSGLREQFMDFKGSYTLAQAQQKYDAFRKGAPSGLPPPTDRPVPAMRPQPLASPAPAGAVITGQALGERVASWVFEHYRGDPKISVHLKDIRQRLRNFATRTTPDALEGFLKGYLERHPPTSASKTGPGKLERVDLGKPRGGMKPPRMTASLKQVIKRGDTVAKDFDRVVKDFESNPEKFSLAQLRQISRAFSDFEEKSWGQLKQLKKSSHPAAAEQARTLQRHRDVYNGLAHKAYLLMVKHTQRLVDDLEKEKNDVAAANPAKRVQAKRTFDAHTAAARVELQKTIRCLVDIGMGPVKEAEPAPRLEDMKKRLDRLDEIRAEADRMITAPSEEEKQAAKSAAGDRKTVEANRKILGAAQKAFDRIEAIGRMPPVEREKNISAAELTRLYGAIEAFDDSLAELKALPTPSPTIDALIRELEKEMGWYKVAEPAITRLTDEMADEHMKTLRGYAGDMKRFFSEIDIRGFARAKANFSARYGKVETFLNGVAGISPQPTRLAEIRALRAEVMKLDPAKIKGAEKELRTKLNAIEAALKKTPDNLYPHTRDLLAIEVKLEAVRAGLTRDVAGEFDAKIKELRSLISGQQDKILEKIAAFSPPQVSRFSDALDYAWLTNNTTRGETKRLALQAIKALEGLFGPAEATKAVDLPWDDRFLFSRGGTMRNLKGVWEDAKAALRLINDKEVHGKLPELDGARPPSADEKKKMESMAAADTAYRPIETRLKATVAAVEKAYDRLFDKTRGGLARTQGPPYADELPPLSAELERLRKDLDETNVDEKVYAALERNRQRDADKLGSDVTDAYRKIQLALGRIAAVKDDLRFTRTSQLAREVDETEKKVADATLPELNRIRYRLTEIRKVAGARYAGETDDRAAFALLQKIKSVIDAVDKQIVALGGTPPPKLQPLPEPKSGTGPVGPGRVGPASKPEPAGEPVVETSLKDAQKEYRDNVAEFKKLNKDLKSQSFASLVALYKKVNDELALGFVPSDDELRGKDADYVRQAALSKAFNKEIGKLSKNILVELVARLEKRMTDLEAIKGRAMDAVGAVDPDALTRAKTEMRRVALETRADLKEYEKINEYFDDPKKQNRAIDALATFVEKLVIDPKAAAARDHKAAQKEIDGLRRKLDEINKGLKGSPEESQLKDMDGRITAAIDQLKAIDHPRAQGTIADFEAARRAIQQLREARDASEKINKTRANIRTLLGEAETLKDEKKELSVLKAGLERLGQIKARLGDIRDGELPGLKGDSSGLKNQISDGLIKIDEYMARLEMVIRVKELESGRPGDASRVEPKKAVDPVESLRENIRAFMTEASRLKDARDPVTQKKNLARLVEIKTALETIRDTEVPKARGDEISVRYLGEEARYAVEGLERLIKDAEYTLKQNTPQGRLDQLKSRIMSERLRARVSTTDDGNELIFTGVDADDLRTQAEAIGNHVAAIYDRFPKAMLIVVKEPDLTHAADAIKRAFSSRLGPLDMIVIHDPHREKSTADVTLFFDRKPLAGRVKTLLADIKATTAKKEAAAKAAETARLKPLKDLNNIARSRGGKAIESDKDKPVLGSHHIYAARVRVGNAAAALTFIRLVARALGKMEANDFLVFAHPAIADGLVNNPPPTNMKIQKQVDAKPGSRVFSLSPSRPGEMYIVLPARSGIGMGRTFGEHMNKLWPTLQRLGFPENPGISEPKEKEASKPREPAGLAPPILDDRKIAPPADAPGGKTAPLKPMKKAKIYGLGQIRPEGQRTLLGRPFPDAVVWIGDMDSNSYKLNRKGMTPVKARLEAVAELYKQHGYTRVLAIYAGPPPKKGAPSAAQTRYEKQFVGIAKEVAGTQVIPIQTAYVDMTIEMDEQPDKVIYVPLRDTDDAEAIIAQYRKHAAEVSKGH